MGLSWLCRLQQARTAGSRNVNLGHLGRAACSVDQLLYTFVGTVAPDHTDELFNVVATERQAGQSILGKLGRAVLIELLGYVVKPCSTNAQNSASEHWEQ